MKPVCLRQCFPSAVATVNLSFGLLKARINGRKGSLGCREWGKNQWCGDIIDNAYLSVGRSSSDQKHNVILMVRRDTLKQFDITNRSPEMKLLVEVTKTNETKESSLQFAIGFITPILQQNSFVEATRQVEEESWSQSMVRILPSFGEPKLGIFEQS